MGIKLVVAAKTDVGKVRTNNEDAYVVADLNRKEKVTADAPTDFDVTARGVLLAVSDGMGGEQAGEVASALVVETLSRVLADNAPESEESKTGITRIIENAVTRANEEVFAAAKDPGKRGMGATLTAVFVHGPSAYIAEIGDSRAYLMRGRRVRQMTKDQSFVQLLVDSGAISKEEAENYPHKNIILQAIGQQRDLNVALGKLLLRRGDRLLLCSDGLSNKVTPEEMREIVCAAGSIDEACTKLIEAANERGGDDNATVVLAEATGEELLVHRDEETVTQTFEVMRAGPNTEVKEIDNAPQAPPAAPASADAAENEERAATAEDEADRKSRPLQMVVALVMMIAIGGLVYLLMR